MQMSYVVPLGSMCSTNARSWLPARSSSCCPCRRPTSLPHVPTHLSPWSLPPTRAASILVAVAAFDAHAMEVECSPYDTASLAAESMLDNLTTAVLPCALRRRNRGVGCATLLARARCCRRPAVSMSRHRAAGDSRGNGRRDTRGPRQAEGGVESMGRRSRRRGRGGKGERRNVSCGP